MTAYGNTVCRHVSTDNLGFTARNILLQLSFVIHSFKVFMRADEFLESVCSVIECYNDGDGVQIE